MKLTDLFKELDRPVAYYPKLTAITGGATQTLFLCQFLYWTGKQRDPSGWIYKTQAEIEEETGLSRTEQETARKHLKRLGLLEERFKGLPRRLEFRPNLEELNSQWELYLETGSSLAQQHKSAIAASRLSAAKATKTSGSTEKSILLENGIIIMPKISNMDCQKSANSIAENQHAIYTEITPETTSENTHTQAVVLEEKESVCVGVAYAEKEEEKTPQPMAASKPKDRKPRQSRHKKQTPSGSGNSNSSSKDPIPYPFPKVKVIPSLPWMTDDVRKDFEEWLAKQHPGKDKGAWQDPMPWAKSIIRNNKCTDGYWAQYQAELEAKRQAQEAEELRKQQEEEEQNQRQNDTNRLKKALGAEDDEIIKQVLEMHLLDWIPCEGDMAETKDGYYFMVMGWNKVVKDVGFGFKKKFIEDLELHDINGNRYSYLSCHKLDPQ